MAGVSLPHVNAVLLADHAYVDKEWGSWVIAGTFNTLFVPRFPHAHHAVWLYLNLSDWVGTHKLSLRWYRLDTQEEVMRSGEFEVSNSDRLAHFERRLNIPSLPVPQPGTYGLEILWDNAYLALRKVTARTFAADKDNQADDEGS